MQSDPTTQETIASLIAADRVVLFMKGDRNSPRCGFSATVVQILDRLIPDYATVDVLADPAIREGVKVYSEWPTIPQLYVDGEFVGGCDLVREGFASGELARTLGVELPAPATPNLTITDSAAAALARARASAGERELHLAIDARFRTGLYFAPAEDGALPVEANGVILYLDPLTAARAEGLVLDAEETPQGPAFRIDNPNAPAAPPGA